VRKHQSNLTGIEDQIIALLCQRCEHPGDTRSSAKSVWYRNLSNLHIQRDQQDYPLNKEWQNRYKACTLLFSWMRFTLRLRGWCHCEQGSLHGVGIDLDCNKDVLGIWIGENESAKFWLSVLNDLKNRGVQDILIICVDNLTGFIKPSRLAIRRLTSGSVSSTRFAPPPVMSHTKIERIVYLAY
jgi:putative transposase